MNRPSPPGRGEGREKAEPARTFRHGQEVVVLNSGLPSQYRTYVEQVDETAGKVQVRFRPREGYSYLFWRDIKDVLEVPDGTDQ